MILIRRARDDWRTTQTSRHPFEIREISGDHSGGETPVPIPNTAVKPTSADGTALATGWESRSLPGISLSISSCFRDVAFKSEQITGSVDKHGAHSAPRSSSTPDVMAPP